MRLFKTLKYTAVDGYNKNIKLSSFKDHRYKTHWREYIDKELLESMDRPKVNTSVLIMVLLDNDIRIDKIWLNISST